MEDLKKKEPKLNSDAKVKNQKDYINVSSFESKDYPMTFIIGARGVGKTIHALAENLLRCYNKGSQFIYLRRTDKMIEKLGVDLSLLSDLTGHTIAKETIRVDGKAGHYLTVEGEPVCMLLALSTDGTMKSNDYHRVDKIIYDEFIDDKKQELKNEAFIMTNFIVTVFRNWKGTVTFLANATDIYNCYFIAFQVMPKSRITKFRSKGIKIVMYDTTARLKERRDKSYIAKWVRMAEGGTSSSLDNAFDGVYNDFITKLTKGDRCRMVLWLDDKPYGLWSNSDRYVLSDKFQGAGNRQKALTRHDIREGRPLFGWEATSELKSMLNAGKLYYTSPVLRSMMLQYFKENRWSE